MQIYVPSRGRAGRVVVLRYESPKYPMTLVVPPEEYDTYSRTYPKTPILQCPAKGIAPTRQWIMEHSPQDIMFFADDDGRFFKRESMSHPKLVNMLGNQPAINRMWQTIARSFNDYPLVGISYRGGNNFKTEPYQEIAKAFSFWGVDRRVLQKHDIRIDITPVMEDFQVILSLLTRGYKNIVWYRWAWNQLSGATGGCSIWRTRRVQARGARKLKRMFPEYVSLKKVKANYGWFNGNARLDVRVQWKKAYENSNTFKK